MPTNGNGNRILWGALALLLTLSMAAGGVIWAEVGKRVTKDEFSMLCGQVRELRDGQERIESLLWQLARNKP